MNCKNIYIFILMCSILVSCKPKYTTNKTILHAESLLQEKPDSAYLLLSKIKNPKKLSSADYAAWCLHITHAQYKLYMDIKSDSLINNSVEYYHRSDLKKYSGTAYYLSGCIAHMHQKDKEAILAYKKAEELLRNTNEHDLKGLVEFTIGYIYFKDELSNESLKYFRKSLIHFKLSGNIKYQAYSYRALSDIYVQLGYSIPSRMQLIEKAINLSQKSGDSINYYTNLARKGELLYDVNYAESTKYLLEGFRHLPELKSYFASFLSFTYSKMNKIDSARYYLKISLADTINNNTKTLIYLAGAYVTKKDGDQNQAFRYLERAYNIRDSVSQKSIYSQLYRIDKQYDLTQKEKENAKLKIANQQNVIIITLLVIFILGVFVIFLLIRNYNKKNQIELELKNQQLVFEVENKKRENEQKRKLLLSKLQNKIDNTLQFKRLKQGIQEKDKREEFINEITKQSVITEKEWQYYIDEVNHLFEGKINNLKATTTELTLTDLIVISLTCLEIDINDCCSLLDMTSNTMYTRRRRIRTRIGIDKDVDLEKWINEYICN